MSATSSDTLQQTVIKVGDNEQEVVFVQLTLEEKMLEPGNFSFIWKNEMGDNYSQDQQKFIQDFIGKPITIHLNQAYIFKGVITQIAFNQNDGLTQDYRVTGTGLGILLSDQTHSTSFYQKDIKHMVDSCFEGIPSNLLSVENKPKKTTPIFYTVQYAESDFSFLVNLAVRHGEWMFYNGEKLVFGEINQEPNTLEAGTDIVDIVFSSSIRSTQMNVVGANYHDDQLLNAAVNPVNTSGLLSSLQDAGSNVFSRSPKKKLYNPNFPTQSSIDQFSATELKARAARLIHLTASSRNATIQLGTTLEIKFGNKSEKYIVTQISHFSNGHQDYSNQFLAFPAAIEVPHYTNPSWFPKADTQTAKIIDNEDSDGMDRVKVHFPWQQDNDNSPWIRIQNPHAGNGKGFRFVPEKDEEVMIGFENGNAEKPYVIGAVFNGSGKSGSGTSSNHLKSISTKSGNSLVLNDENGSITVTDKGGNTLIMDGSGKITLKCSDSLLIDAANDIELKSQKIKLNASVSVDIAGKTTVDVAANSVVTKATTISSEATANNTIKSSGSMNMEGLTTSVKGSTSTSVEGAMLDLKGTGITNVKGGILNLN